jgi:hypothetical protein
MMTSGWWNIVQFGNSIAADCNARSMWLMVACLNLRIVGKIVTHSLLLAEQLCEQGRRWPKGLAGLDTIGM